MRVVQGGMKEGEQDMAAQAAPASQLVSQMMHDQLFQAWTSET
jgi:hypothetical protein